MTVSHCNLILGELVREIGGTLRTGTMPPLNGEAQAIGRIVTDSREVQEGDLYWAIVGHQVNGNDFVEEAMCRGALGAVVCGRRFEPWAGRFVVEVDDTQWALWQLAAAVRYRFAGDVIAITGSIGKTTTREMIHATLRGTLAGSTTPCQVANQLALPLSMIQWNPRDDYAAVELTGTIAGEIDSLASLAAPRIGIVTPISPSHLEGFASIQAAVESKAELLAALPDDGWAVLSGDDPWHLKIAKQCRAQVLFVGRSAGCDLVATDVEARLGELRFRVDGRSYRVAASGRHFLHSALFAIAVGRILKLSYLDVADGLANFAGVPGRCETLAVGETTVIHDAYNADPTSMRAALELMRLCDARGRRLVVCGDMKELGNAAIAAHRNLGRQMITVGGADRLIVCGKYAETVAAGALGAGMPARAITACGDADEAAGLVSREAKAGDVVLVKGSANMNMQRVVESLQQEQSVELV